MRYSLETPFVRSAAEDAWGYRRPTHPALRRCATSPPSPPRPRERSRLQLTPDSVGGTRIDAHAPRSAAADALLHCIYSGTALRCISPSPLYPRTRCPGLTENGSALRTTPPHSRSSASPKRIGMDIRHTPTHSPLTLRVSGVTENSAFPTRLRLSPTLSRLCLTPSHRYSSQRRIGDALLTSRLCLSLPHIATPANSASQMRYSLETPFVRSTAEDAWGYRRPTHPSALRRCATTPSSPP